MKKYYLAWGQQYKQKPELLTSILHENPEYVRYQSAKHFKNNPLYEYVDIITINDTQLLKHSIIMHKMNITNRTPLYIGFYFNYKTCEYELDSNAIHNNYEEVIDILQSDLIVYDINHKTIPNVQNELMYFKIPYYNIDELSILCDQIKLN